MLRKNNSRRFGLTFICLICCLSLQAQEPGLDAFDQKRKQISKIGLITLGSWALGNISSGALMLNRSEGSNRRFYQMNLYWNIANLGLSGFGLYSLGRENLDLSPYETWQAQASIEKLLLFNAGLDVAYILGGLYLKERSRRGGKNQDLFEGFGNSIILQGSFLFLFDLSLYAFHHHHAGSFQKIFEGLRFSSNHIQIIFSI